jgi:hypothetical protein
VMPALPDEETWALYVKAELAGVPDRHTSNTPPASRAAAADRSPTRTGDLRDDTCQQFPAGHV